MKKLFSSGKAILWLMVIVLFLLINTSLYTVGESEVAVVRMFSEITKVHVYSEEYVASSKKDLEALGITADVVVGKGLNFKIPFISNVEKYSTKLLTYTSVPEEINTLDRRKIVIQLYAQYNIINPGIVSIRTSGDYLSKLNALLDDKIYPIVIKTANGINFSEFFDAEVIDKKLTTKIADFNTSLISGYGVKIVDTGMFKKSIPESNYSAIESKMIAEIDKTLISLRTTADKDYNNRINVAETAYNKTVNEARQEAALIKANADQKALSMVQNAMKVDPEFFGFIKRMELLSNIEGTPVIIDKTTNIFKDMNK